MKCGVLFSGGKDSTYAAYLCRKFKNEISCLISIFSKNPDSYMFHTPSINQVSKQAKVMDIPLMTYDTIGEEEKELDDLEYAISDCIDKYGIKAVVTGAVESAYQASRVQRICDKLHIECFNPLWQKDQIELLKELVNNDFKVIITSVRAYPLDEKLLGVEIDDDFFKKAEELYERYKINPAGEGGEFETLVVNCPLFKRPLEIVDKKIMGNKNSWTLEVELK